MGCPWLDFCHHVLLLWLWLVVVLVFCDSEFVVVCCVVDVCGGGGLGLCWGMLWLLLFLLLLL